MARNTYVSYVAPSGEKVIDVDMFGERVTMPLWRYLKTHWMANVDRNVLQTEINNLAHGRKSMLEEAYWRNQA